MQTPETQIAESSLNFKLGTAAFVGYMLLAIDGLYQAEKFHSRVSGGWRLQFCVWSSWVFMWAIGYTVWMEARKGKLDRQNAVRLLMPLGFAIWMAYQAIGIFASGHR